MKLNCILIGGSGFLGTHVALKLIESGCDVTIVDKNPPTIYSFSTSLKDVNFILADFQDYNKIGNLLANKDVLFHFACSSLPGSPIEKIDDDIRDNIERTVKFFQVAALCGIKKIVFPSSGGTVYGPSKTLPISEESPTNPICSHGITKLAVEKYLILLHKVYGIDYLIFRISNPYGPGQNTKGKQGLIANVISRLLMDKPITVFGEGKNVRDYIYIDDVVQAFLFAIQANIKNEIFNIGSGIGLSINEVINLISNLLNKKPKVLRDKDRITDVDANILDIRKFCSKTNWKPETIFEEGLRYTNEWIYESIK